MICSYDFNFGHRSVLSNYRKNSQYIHDTWSFSLVPFALAVILKQKCQCLLKKKSNFFGYNYASINTKRGLFLPFTQLSNTLLLPQVVTHLIGEHTEYLSKLEKDSHRVKMISCARTHKMTLCREHSLNTYRVLANSVHAHHSSGSLGRGGREAAGQGTASQQGTRLCP